MPIYLNEKQYAAVITLADSLSADGLNDPSGLMHKTRAEVELGLWSEATATLEELKTAWENSPFSDKCGENELLYLKARILFGSGNTAAAISCVQRILEDRDSCNVNAYFRETISRALKLPH
jgi:hypothetical protein